MMVQNILLSNESYTHEGWEFRNISVGFSRLYYIVAGEAYYEEEGRVYPLKTGHLYLTPVRKTFSLYENPQNKLLHTYVHVLTLPAADRFTEIAVMPDSPLEDAVLLWRKYAKTTDTEFLKSVITLVLSCIERACTQTNTAAQRAKEYIDGKTDCFFDMKSLCNAVGYSREHITRSFLTAFGTTPKQYFQLRRMNAALERLISGARVSDVAEELGYATPYAFSKAFKNHFGESPQHYLTSLQSS
jgi:AraC-like DNA-binding protein